MTSIKVNARAISIPVSNPTSISTRVLKQRHYVLVSVGTDATKEIGIGYAYVGTTGGESVVKFIDEVLSPIISSRDSNDIVGIWEAMFQESLLIGRRGVALRAISAIDIALWDLAAKRAGLPLAVMLGGSLKPIPAYASGGYYQPDKGSWADAVSAEIKFNRSLGFVDHKIKVGGLSVEEDARRVAAAINAIEGTGRLAIDANNAYKSVNEAIKAAKVFEKAAGEVGLWWFEEPLSTEDVKGMSEVRARIDTPLATGEISQSRHEFRSLIEEKAADILQPDVGVLGGVTEYMRVTRAAETFNLPTAPHWHANIHAHLAAASTTCIVIEHFALEKDIYNFENIVTKESRLDTKNGFALLSDRSGLGIDFDESAIQKYGIKS
jgi:L-alanine-DL-glutamate epimerase-like enolase superfamily enzyme